MSDKIVPNSMMDPGAGISLSDTQKRQIFSIPDVDNAAYKPSEEEPTAAAEHKDIKGKSVWLTTPTFEDQFKRFPQTTRMVGPVVAVFNVAEPAQLQDMNALLAKQQPEDAPSIVLASRKENFYEGKWLMLLEYFRVEYKQLLTST